MQVQQALEAKLKKNLEPILLEVINESPQHQVPSGSESHFRIVIVSSKFEGLPMIKRHQMVYQLISEELKHAIHAFSQHTFTSDEWIKKGGKLPDSPPCAKKIKTKGKESD